MYCGGFEIYCVVVNLSKIDNCFGSTGCNSCFVNIFIELNLAKLDFDFMQIQYEYDKLKGIARFFATQILREINFETIRVPKKIEKIYQNQNSEPMKLPKLRFC